MREELEDGSMVEVVESLHTNMVRNIQMATEVLPKEEARGAKKVGRWGRSEETKNLFQDRIAELKKLPTSEVKARAGVKRKYRNRIVHACRADYRRCLTTHAILDPISPDPLTRLSILCDRTIPTPAALSLLPALPEPKKRGSSRAKASVCLPWVSVSTIMSFPISSSTYLNLSAVNPMLFQVAKLMPRHLPLLICRLARTGMPSWAAS